MSKINIKDIKIEIINDDHNINHFISYENELVNFLVEDALKNQGQRLSVTFLWFYENELVSYLTLLNDRINLEEDLKQFFKEKDVHYNSLPALKIGRICVDDKFLRKGLGKLMIEFAIRIAYEISKDKSGCRFITLDAKQDSRAFYKKLNFEILKERNQTMAMYLDLRSKTSN
jgi:predicted GNAT family N-acyltransferase